MDSTGFLSTTQQFISDHSLRSGVFFFQDSSDTLTSATLLQYTMTMLNKTIDLLQCITLLTELFFPGLGRDLFDKLDDWFDSKKKKKKRENKKYRLVPNKGKIAWC